MRKYFTLFGCTLATALCAQIGLLPFKQNYKWGYIDNTGKVVIEPQYDEALAFDKNLAIVRNSAKYGVINSEGKVIVPIEEKEIKIVSHRFAAFRKDTAWGMVDVQGKTKIDPKYKNITQIDAQLFSFKAGNLLGLYSAINDRITDPKYKSVTNTKQGIIFQQGDLFGMLDSLLNVVIKPEYAGIEVFSNIILCKSKDFWGVAKSNGTILLNPEYMAYKLYSSDLIAFKTKKGGWLMYNILQNKILQTEEQESFTLLDNDFIMLNKSHKHGVITKTGNTILGQTFSNIHLNENLFLVEQAGRWGLNDKTGAVVIPTIHAKLFPFKKNLAIFESEAGKGVISNKGKVLVQPIYKDINIVGNMAKCLNNEGKIENFKVDAGVVATAKTTKKTTTKKAILSPDVLHNHVWAKGAGKKWGLLGHDTVFIASRYDEIEDYDANTSFTYQKVDYRMNPKIFGFINSNKLVALTNNKIGLANKATGQIISQPQFWYVFIEDFRKNDIARVILEGGQQALLQKNGKLITEITTIKEKKTVKYRLDYLAEIKNNTIRFCTGCYINYDGNWAQPKVENGKWGFLSADGKLLIDPQFESATDFENDRSIVQQKGLFGLINTAGNVILKPEHLRLEYLKGAENTYLSYETKKEKFGLINQDGKNITSISYDKIFQFSDGLARVMQNGKYGYIDENDKIIIAPQFDNALDFSEGFAAVMIKNRWGYIDKTGTQRILPTYITAGNFKDYLAPVFKDGKNNYISQEEKILISFPFNRCNEFSNGYAIVLSQDNRYGLIDQLGNAIIEPVYDEITPTSSPNYYKVKQNGIYKLFSLGAKKVITKKNFTEMGNLIAGKAKVKLDDYYNYIDSTGKIIINKKYQAAADFQDELARVKFENKTGFIAPNGFLAVDFVYNNVMDFSNSFTFAEGAAKLWRIIDRNGRNITFDQFINPKPFVNGFSVVQTPNRKFQLVNTNGELVFGETQFETLYSPENEVCRFKLGKYGLANTQGYFSVNPKYDYMSEFKNGQAIVGVYTKKGVFDLDGKIIIEPLYDVIDFVGNNTFALQKTDEIGYYNLTSNWLLPLTK